MATELSIWSPRPRVPGHETLRFGPGVATSGWIKTEVEVGQCDEDHDGVDDWVAVTATGSTFMSTSMATAR